MSPLNLAKQSASFALTLAAAAALAACATTAATSEAEPFYVRHAMQAQVNPAIAAIWNVGNAAMDESGGIDPALMDDGRWAALTDAAGALEQSGREMAAAQTLRAAREDNWTTDEFEVSMDQVQAALDADPEGFRRLAADFARHTAALKAAAESRDAAATGALVAQMDAKCASCHAQYWYAE